MRSQRSHQWQGRQRQHQRVTLFNAILSIFLFVQTTSKRNVPPFPPEPLAGDSLLLISTTSVAVFFDVCITNRSLHRGGYIFCFCFRGHCPRLRDNGFEDGQNTAFRGLRQSLVLSVSCGDHIF